MFHIHTIYIIMSRPKALLVGCCTLAMRLAGFGGSVPTVSRVSRVSRAAWCPGGRLLPGAVL